MNHLQMREEEYIKIPVSQRAYRICEREMSGWIEILEFEERRQ
jgi:hypothetical protein